MLRLESGEPSLTRIISMSFSSPFAMLSTHFFKVDSALYTGIPKVIFGMIFPLSIAYRQEMIYNEEKISEVWQ